MRIVVIGATGTIGTAVTNALESTHQIVRASRHGPMKVDIGDPASIAMLFDSVSEIDAITCCAASVKTTPLALLSNDDIAQALQAKLIGQVNLACQALRHLRDGGSITLTKTSMCRNNYESQIFASVVYFFWCLYIFLHARAFRGINEGCRKRNC